MPEQQNQKLLDKFLSDYNKLNEQQKLAVDTIEGPVMVIAGPGTGKTQILAARIGKILLDTDALPQNILCLTYTDAGAIAMRRRLLQFIGPDAYRVNIYTFHSFCNDIIQENLSLFEKNALNPVSDLQRIELFRRLIDGFPKNHILKRYRGDVYFEIASLQHLFSVMKSEGWSPAFLKERIEVYLKRIETDDEFRYKNDRKGQWKKGDFKPSYEEQQLRMQKLLAAVGEFDRFQKMMRDASLYDFDDMINWVIKAFEENKNLLANYQEKYQYILVDEYQDTSGTQNKLVELLISYWEHPNVFVVGDDDQSIFRFQGANVENMAAFAESYTGLLKVVLTNNYRSTQPILNISKTLIENNNERLVKKFEGLTKELISSRDHLKNIIDDPTIVEYKNEREELADVTEQISALISQGVQPGRIAVIYKENKYGDELYKYLSLKNIPVYSRRSVDIMQHPFTARIIQVLRYLAAEHDIPYSGDELLFEILHFDFYKIAPIEIAKLMVETNQKKYNSQSTSLRQHIYEKANTPAKTLFDPNVSEALSRFSKTFESLIGDVPNVTVQTLFENIITKAGVLGYIMQSNEKINLMQLLTALFDFIKDETSRNPLMTIQSLVTTIDLMRIEGLAIPVKQTAGSDKGVNLLTAHGSKGLEFEHVFVTGLNSGLWEKKRRPSSGYKFPDTVFASLAASSDDEELRRLFYVALTRAEKFLQISYSRYKADGKEQEPSMFLAEILQQHDIPIRRQPIDDNILFQYEVLNFTALAPQLQNIEEDFISALLEKFVMNVTSLNNYLKCPLEFYFKNLIKIPAGKSENTEFGSAIHFALQRLFEKMQNDPAQNFAKAKDLLEDFKWYMQRHRENFTAEAFTRRMEYGEEVLTSYYDNYHQTWNKIVATERTIKNVTVKGVPLKGKIDKMEFTGKDINVVDYKTGDYASNYTTEKLAAPNDKNPDGGDYWRQAVFYKILLDNYEVKDWKVVSTEFDFIEPDKKKVYKKIKVIIQPPDIETVSQQIVTVWNKIQQRDFYTGCGKPDCHWCNFVKDNNLHIALHELVEEEDE